MRRIEKGALALAAIAAVLVPALVIFGGDAQERAKPEARFLRPGRIKALPQIATIPDRPLFAPVLSPQDAVPADAPELLGIAGRINADAVAFVRGSTGESRTLKPGDSVDGWRLVSLAADAAFFARGRDQVRVTIPTGDASESDPDAAATSDQ